MVIFRWKKKWLFFLIFAHNIDHGYTLEPPHWGGSNKYWPTTYVLEQKIRKLCIPQETPVFVFYLKGGCKGVFFIRTCLHDTNKSKIRKKTLCLHLSFSWTCKIMIWFGVLFNVPVNNFAVIFGRNHRFLCIYQYSGKLKVSCTRALYGDHVVRILNLLLRSQTLCHWVTAPAIRYNESYSVLMVSR